MLICSGAELAEFYETAIADMTELIDLPSDMHLPFIPHITLGYEADQRGLDPEVPDPFLSDAMTRTGPITFDRLRFAFGGDITDVPITSKVEAAPPTPAAVVESRPQAQPTTAAGSIREVWDGPLR